MQTLSDYIVDSYQKELNDLLHDALTDPIDTAVEVLKWFDKNREAIKYLHDCGYGRIADWYTIMFKQQQILKNYANIERGTNSMSKSMHPGFYKRLGTAEEIHKNVMSKEYERQYEELRKEFENFMEFYSKNIDTINLINKLWKDGAYQGVRHYLIDAINAPMSRIIDDEYFNECMNLHEQCMILIWRRDMALLKDHAPLLAGMAERLHYISQQIKDLCWMKTCLELSFGCCGPID